MPPMYRDLPAVESLVQLIEQMCNDLTLPRALLVSVARAEIAAARLRMTDGGFTSTHQDLARGALAQLRASITPSLQAVINATGVIIQTNLGRAPLSAAALQAMQSVNQGYSNLEYDLAQGERGSRAAHLHDLLCRLTGAEAALVVNNNAAAIYLALSALAVSREVIISRGQAVEIGGGFRIPDILRQSGATLVEVGTTNRTFAHDYAAAINDRTALLMSVHTSNFRLIGFVHETPLAELVALAREHHIITLDDLGSGTLLPTAPYGLAAEPTVQERIAAGADLVTFSGDKLLGGPQAGVIVGKSVLIDRLSKHPLARALRVDKTTLAGLEATFHAYLLGRATEDIPIWRMIAATTTELRDRAERLVGMIGDASVMVASCTSTIGGGALPGETLPSYALAITTQAPDAFIRYLRQATPPVIGRIAQGVVLLDMRTVLVEQESQLIDVLRVVLDRSS